MPKKSANILKAKTAKEKITRKPDGLKKETISQAAANLVSLQPSSSNIQVAMMDICTTTSSISETAATTSKPFVSTAGTTPSHQQQLSTSSPANLTGKPAAVTSIIPASSSPADPNLTNPEFYTLEALEENVNFDELLMFVDDHYAPYVTSEQFMQDFEDELNFEDFNFPFQFDENNNI